MQKADDVPKLCHAIEQNLCLPDEKRKSSLRNFLTLKEFEKWVAEDVGITLDENEKKVSVEYLDSSGIVSNQTVIILLLLSHRLCIWVLKFVLDPSGCVITSSVHSSLRPTFRLACRLKNPAKCH